MLKIIEATKTYTKNQFRAVDCVSLEVKKGEIFGFLGPNGAGKSTTIKMLTGILPFEFGDIQVCGHSIKSQRVEAQKCIGYVPDVHNVYETLSGIEYINFMADIYGVNQSQRTERMNRYLDLFELSGSAGKQIKSYSHGMKQKITIIGALIHQPKLWVLDEPLTGLDPQSSFQLKKLMKEHCEQGNTVFFSSHVLEVVEKLCDRIGIINHGKLIAVGTLEEIKKKTDLSLEDFFLSVTGKQHEAVPQTSQNADDHLHNSQGSNQNLEQHIKGDE